MIECVFEMFQVDFTATFDDGDHIEPDLHIKLIFLYILVGRHGQKFHFLGIHRIQNIFQKARVS